MMSANPPATASIAASQLTRRPSISGCSKRSSSDSVSPSAEPFEQRRPRLAGCCGSPAIAAPPPPSGVASTPQPTPQYGHVERRVASAITGGASPMLSSGAISVYVALIAPAAGEAVEPRLGGVRRKLAVLGRDCQQRQLHV